MSHYMFTREGATQMLGLKNPKQIERYRKNAIDKGLVPSKLVGGIELFDIDILLGNAPNISYYDMGYTDKQIEDFKKNGKLI